MVRKARILLAGLLILPSLSLVTSVALPSARAMACTDTLLTFPAWYKGMQAADCSFSPLGDDGKVSNGGTVNFQKTAIAITLNIVNIILQLVGYASVAFLIFGGFKYMTSQGESSEIVGAKKTIMNAIIGLVISLMSVAIINLVAGAF